MNFAKQYCSIKVSKKKKELDLEFTLCFPSIGGFLNFIHERGRGETFPNMMII